jgi:hypothetical protein
MALKNVSETQMLMEKNKTKENSTASDKPAQPLKSPEEIAEAKSRLS